MESGGARTPRKSPAREKTAAAKRAGAISPHRTARPTQKPARAVRIWTARRAWGSIEAINPQSRATALRADASPFPACGKIPNSRPAPPSPRTARINGSRIMYQSDITQFINQLKDKKPTLEEEQRRGRALLWDKQPIDLDERQRQQQSRVQQTSYVYYQNF
jgi:hypothetical protein